MSEKNTRAQTIKDMVHRVLGEEDAVYKHMAHGCCRCEKCTCGKHLCKFQSAKLNLKPTSTQYNDQYTKKKATRDYRSASQSKLNIPNDPYHPKQFIDKSQYRQQYYRKKSKNDKVKRAQAKPDNIQLGGPAFLNTTYKNNYQPFYQKPPQKIKNPENLGVGGTKMYGTSSYRNSYNWNNRKPGQRERPIKPEGNLSVNNQTISFNGQSSYDADYHKYPGYKNSKDSFAPHQVYRPTHGLRPRSSYRCDYVNQKYEPCPALKCPAEKCYC